MCVKRVRDVTARVIFARGDARIWYPINSFASGAEINAAVSAVPAPVSSVHWGATKNALRAIASVIVIVKASKLEGAATFLASWNFESRADSVMVERPNREN